MKKTIPISVAISSGRFPQRFYSDSNIKNLYLVIMWQIKSAWHVLATLRDRLKFHATASKNSVRERALSKTENRAFDSELATIAAAHGVKNSPTYSKIHFEWALNFLTRGTVGGIQEYVRLYYKYEILKFIYDEEFVDNIVSSIEVDARNWYENSVSSHGFVYFYDERRSMTTHLEIYLPKKYRGYLARPTEDFRLIVASMEKNISVGNKLGHILIGWR